MGYEIIEVNDKVLEHFEKVKHLIQNKIPAKFEEPRITKVWVSTEGYHDVYYQIHLETKDHHHHVHHWTVLYEVKGQHAGHVELKDIHEGFKSFI
jgi:hypothetical protein